MSCQHGSRSACGATLISIMLAKLRIMSPPVFLVYKHSMGIASGVGVVICVLLVETLTASEFGNNNPELLSAWGCLIRKRRLRGM